MTTRHPLGVVDHIGDGTRRCARLPSEKLNDMVRLHGLPVIYSDDKTDSARRIHGVLISGYRVPELGRRFVREVLWFAATPGREGGV